MRKLDILTGSDSGCSEPRKKAATRIFETARDLFYRRGIRAVGVDEIVCQAGVTKPSLYRSFDSKDDLVAKCLESFAAEGMAEIDARIEAAGPEPLPRLKALIAHYAEEMANPGFRGCPMSNAAVEFPEEGHPGRLVVESCKTAVRERVVGLTRALSVDDPEALADGLILLIEGAFSAHHVFGSQGPASAFSRAAERLISSHLKV
ncbi:MAG TPA: TetR/AcrR family transcriptional regulator [Allosphingosinicella sp.]|nr:TetR/AcrR family transcriptional regulator [Allosphingosinicella sp.]